MKTLRFLFVMLGFVTSLGSTAEAAAPFRLFEVSVTRFVRGQDGGRVENGLLDARGAFTLVRSTPSSFVDSVPEEWLGKTMIYTEAWTAYGELGPEAVANYTLGNNGNPVSIRGLVYYYVLAHVNARLDVAPVINLSTRGRISHGAGGGLIGGFVVEGKPGTVRRVLVRAIGAGLRPFGVEDAAADPYLSIFKGSMPYYFNDNWGERFDADEIEQTAKQVGAFPLDRSSKDAVLLVELEPGNYTAYVTTEVADGGGTALVEIYILP